MEYRKQKIDESIKLNVKTRNKNHVESMTVKLLNYYSDPSKNTRKKIKFLCKYCCYVDTSRIGGSAITTVICANCNDEMSFGNTCTDVLCNKCAEGLKLCKHCGQKMD